VKQTQDLTRLYQTIHAAQTEAECASLMEDLCSQSELRAMRQRLAVAAMLIAGETFITIQQTLDVSSAIVARVNRALQNSEGGLRQVLERLEQSEP